MIILSHRGYWLDPSEKNTSEAFERSFSIGFGTETDVRDLNGELVVSHDMPTGNEMSWAGLLGMLDAKDLPLAINIKADGLALLLQRAMADYQGDWFVFDMSIPDMRAHLQAGNPVFARMSEVEQSPAWFDRIAGIWLDCFDGIWYDAPTVLQLLEAGKRVCVVSPELHGRPHEELWQCLLPLREQAGLMLCTDLPELARNFFGV